MVGGKFKKLNYLIRPRGKESTEVLSDQVNTRAVSRRQNELVGKFKMVAGDVIGLVDRLWSTRTFQ